MKVTGEKEVLASLNKSIREIKGKTKAGIMDALLYVEEESIVRTPVDTGNLRGSFYKTLLSFRGDKIAGEIGNTAEYALYVHEDLDAAHTVGEAKFLENVLIEKSKTILNIIKNRVKI